ncbi:unnamed protein product, partial [Brassica rapa subsp. narinosa]
SHRLLGLLFNRLERSNPQCFVSERYFARVLTGLD